MSETLTVSTTPATLLEKAIDKGVDIDQLKELMDLQERWEKKEARKAFFEALSQFQTIVPDLKKTKTAKIVSTKGSFSYKYADLGSIGNSIKKSLQECGLSYRWEFNEQNGKMKVTCLISHKDGHVEATSMEGDKDDSGAKNNIQQKGSTHTYLQRYTLIGALGLTTADQDDDAKGTTKPDPKVEYTPEEIQEQWKTAITQTKTKIELQGLYLKNKKKVDADERLQQMFKAHEETLKTGTPEKVNLP